MIDKRSDRYTLPCKNCQAPHTADSSVSTCFLITIRRSGRSPVLSTIPTSTSLVVPLSRPGRLKLRDIIWAEFESVRVENEYSRHQLLSQRRARKGDLRNDAPIPWLRWKSPWGEEGQTRNLHNFERLWDKITESTSSCMFVTCTFLSGVSRDQTDADAASDDNVFSERSIGNSDDEGRWSDISSSSSSESSAAWPRPRQSITPQKAVPIHTLLSETPKQIHHDFRQRAR